MLVTGAHKASILARAVEGPLTALVSASALQLHKKCSVIVDDAAAQELTQMEYNRWIFEQEPEWAKYRA